MMLLVCFDLPRNTKINRKHATKYRKKLIEMGFVMKQYSLYEREIRNTATRDKVIELLRKEIPAAGMITLYVLPNEVNDNQIQILGDCAVKLTVRKPRFVVL